jgi:hypothetical protein
MYSLSFIYPFCKTKTRIIFFCWRRWVFGKSRSRSIYTKRCIMIYNWLYDFRMKTMFGRHHDLVNSLCLKWSRMCSVYRHHNTVLFSFMTNHRVCNKSSTTGVTFRAETPYPDFTPICNGVRVAQSLDRRFFLFFVFFFVVMLSVLRTTYGFWLPLWHLQTFHTHDNFNRDFIDKCEM